MVNYYIKQGCDIFVMDNFSNDGTYEWLLENNISTTRIDTNDSFYLSKLQRALVEEIKKISPDWIIYTGVDMFYHFNVCQERKNLSDDS